MSPKNAWMIVGLGLLLNAGIFYIFYTTFYGNAISVRTYQRLDDQNHNLTTIALQRCLGMAVINHADNWDRVCSAYGLGQGCGLPQDDYNRLASGLMADEQQCRINHQYQIPKEAGASMDSQGHLLPRKEPTIPIVPSIIK